MRDAAAWQAVLRGCGCAPDTALVWAPLWAAALAAAPRPAGDAELALLLGQALVETGLLTQLEENLNYSAARLVAVWPSHFPTLGAADVYAHQPERLANLVYGGRLGDTQPGDGWRFRGRGVLQLTGRADYEAIGRELGMALADDPDQLAEPGPALSAALGYWRLRVSPTALGSVASVTRCVNGGLIGLAARQALTARAQRALQANPAPAA